MPIVKIEGVGKVKFPDSMSPAQIEAAIQQEFGRSTSTPKTDEYDPLEGMSGYDKFMAGVGRGFDKVGSGVKQIWLEGGEAIGAYPEGTANAFTQQKDAEYALTQPLADTGAGGAGEFVGQVAPGFLIPGGVAGSAMTRMATAGAGAGLDAAIQYVPEGGSRAQNALVGAGMGGGTNLLMQGIGKPINKMMNSFRGEPTAADNMLSIAQREGVPVSYGDVAGPGSAASRLEVNMERVPVVGTAGFREGQMQAGKEAANAFGMNRGFANKALKEISDTGEKIQDSAGRKLKFWKDVTKKRTEEVARIADGHGPVPNKNLNKAANDLIKELDAVKRPGARNDDLIEFLEGYTTQGVEDFSTTINQVRPGLRKALEKHKKGANVVIGDQDSRIITKLKSAIDKDLDEFANTIDPTLAKKWKMRNKVYRDRVVPFKDKNTRLAKIFDTEEPDQIFSQFIKSGKKDKARILYKALDQEGRDAVRSQIFKEAYDSAISATSSGEVFSPAKFAGKLRDLDEPISVFFKQGGKTPVEEVKGFTNLMEHIKRAGQYGENPPTGSRWLDAALYTGLGAGAVVSPESVVAGGGAALAIKGLLTTEAGRNFLLASSRYKPGSVAMNKLVEQMNNQLPKIAGVASTSDQEQ